MSEPGPAPGRFVWYDHMSREPQKAIEFYNALFGWNTKPVDMGPMGTYNMLNRDGVEFGGVVNLGDEPAPSHWMAYVMVADVDAVAEQAKSLGGTVASPPMDVPGTGRFAVIGDPTGAYISPFQYAMPAPPEPEGLPPAGSFCWHELLTNDVGAAKDFYTKIFPWESVDVDMGPIGTYTLLKRNGRDLAGMMAKPPDTQGQPSHWLYYVAVEDVDAAASKAQELGGAQLAGPMDIPNVGRIAVLQDPTGAGFALFKAASG